MNQRTTTHEVEDASWEVVQLRTNHHNDDPALQLVDEFLAAPEPLDEAQRRLELQNLFRQLWRDRPPVVVKVFVVGKEHTQ